MTSYSSSSSSSSFDLCSNSSDSHHTDTSKTQTFSSSSGYDSSLNSIPDHFFPLRIILLPLNRCMLSFYPLDYAINKQDGSLLEKVHCYIYASFYAID